MRAWEDLNLVEKTIVRLAATSSYDAAGIVTMLGATEKLREEVQATLDALLLEKILVPTRPPGWWLESQIKVPRQEGPVLPQKKRKRKLTAV